MVWESKTTRSDPQRSPNQNPDHSQNHQDYTKHYVYEPNSFVPILQTGYREFIQLIKTPDYSQFKTMPYSIHRDPVWNTDTRKNKAELERVAFYHCDQVGTPQSLSNEKGECIWEVELNTWGKAQKVKLKNQDQVLEQTNIRFQGQYYDEETELHYNSYRYYEPDSGRYISKDPIGLQGGLNTSVYVTNTNQWVDPIGLNDSIVLSAKCTYQIANRVLNCSKNSIDYSGGVTDIKIKTESVSIVSSQGVFSGRDSCVNNSSDECINTKDIGPPLPGTYIMRHVDKFDGSWWLDEGRISRLFRDRSEFYLHKGSVSWGCITVDKFNKEGMDQWKKLEKMLEGTIPTMTIEK